MAPRSPVMEREDNGSDTAATVPMTKTTAAAAAAAKEGKFAGNAVSPNNEPLGDGAVQLGNSEFDSVLDMRASAYVPTNRFSATLNRLVPHGGRLSNNYSLAAVTLSSGIITLPSAFQMLGVVPSILVLAYITVSTVYSVYILLQAVDRTGRRCVSYESLSRVLLGRGWDYFAAFNMWMVCFGSCVSYVISIGDLLTRAVDSPSVAPFWRSRWGVNVMTIAVWAVLMLPMCIPKEINSLRYASVIGVMCMVYFVVVVIVHACLNGFEGGRPKHTLDMFKTGNNTLIGFSLFIFAFMCQTNTLEVYREMQKPSPARLSVDTASSMSLICVLYIACSVFGYLDFGNEISDSILRYYDVRNDALVAVAYVGIGFKLCVGFAICMQPSRDSVYYCIGRFVPLFRSVRTVPFWLNAIICTVMSIVALILGLFIPSVTIVFGLVGSFCGSFLCFIYPALYIMYCGNWSRKTVGWFHYLSTYFLLISGVIGTVFGTIATIYNMVNS